MSDTATVKIQKAIEGATKHESTSLFTRAFRRRESYEKVDSIITVVNSYTSGI